eukprot:gene25384-11045_t
MSSWLTIEGSGSKPACGPSPQMLNYTNHYRHAEALERSGQSRRWPDAAATRSDREIDDALAEMCQQVAYIHSRSSRLMSSPISIAVMPSKSEQRPTGVTPRRWMAWCNPELTSLISEKLGDDTWINDAGQLGPSCESRHRPCFQ